MGASDAESNGAEPASAMRAEGATALSVAFSGKAEVAHSSSVPSVLFDALPYVDSLGEAQQQEVSLLLQREMEAIAAENGGTPPDYLKDVMPLPETPQLDNEDSLLGKEFRRKQRGETLQALDFTHVHTFPNPSGGGKSATDVKEWEEALGVSRQLCGHATTAQINLSLMTSHAPASWQHALKVLGGAAEREKQRVRKLTEAADTVCKNRKLEQLEAAATLKQLQEDSLHYSQKSLKRRLFLSSPRLVFRNIQIMEAISPLALEVSALRAKCLVRSVLVERVSQSRVGKGILPEEYMEESEFDMEGWHRAVGEEPPASEAKDVSTDETADVADDQTAMEEDGASET